MKLTDRTGSGPFASRHPCRAITMVEVVLVLLVLAALTLFFLPHRGRGKVRLAQRVQCMHNLKQISVAFRLFADDHTDRFPQGLSTNEGGTLEFRDDIAAHLRVLSNRLASPNVLRCPAHRGNAVTQFSGLAANHISYFLGMRADPIQPESILAGDSNLTTNGVPVVAGWLIPRTNLVAGWGRDRHARSGIIGISDGSVLQLTSGVLNGHLSRLPNFTNRFLLP